MVGGGQAAVDELLPPKTRVDGHNEDQVEVFDDVFQHADRGMRIEGDTRLTPGGFNLLYHPVEVIGRFGVDGNTVRAGFGKAFDVAAGRVDHEVNVEKFCRVFSDLLDDELPEGDVGHEVAVHHVEVKPVGFGGVDKVDGLIEAAEVCGE